MQKYEVEVKSLLGSQERADELRTALHAADPASTLVSQNKQLNHYFAGGTLANLAGIVSSHLSETGRTKLADFAARAKDFSVRSRFASEGTQEKVLFVLKASVGDDSSANGVARMELEEPVALSLEGLDNLILSAGFAYQAKWSREREEYAVAGSTVTLDKNAGYGWLAEFERVVDNEEQVAAARAEIQALMDTVGATELHQDRLARMFDFYNTHWQEYYGTDKIFTLE